MSVINPSLAHHIVLEMLTPSTSVSSYLGCPPTASLFGKTIDSILDGTVPCAVPRGFVLQLETARFSNRLSKAVAACLEEVQGVSHRVVTQMEEEFAKLQRLLYPENSGKVAFLPTIR